VAVKLKNIILLQFPIIIMSIAGILAKKASAAELFSVEFIVYYSLEMFTIGIYAVLWQQIIKRFEISVAYANKGTLIIWTFIWAIIFFNESITINNILGAILVIFGILMVFRDA